MKFLVFLLTVIALTCCVGAVNNNCDPCRCEGVDNVNKTLITCSGVVDIFINLVDLNITAVNSDAFDNNTNMTRLHLYNNQITEIPPGFLGLNIALTTLRLTRPAREITFPPGYKVYYGGDSRPVDLKEENKTTNQGIWNTNILVPTSATCELSVDKCESIIAAYKGPTNPGFTHSAEIAARFDINPVAAETRHVRRAANLQRRSVPGQPPYDMTLTDLDRKIILTSNVFVNNATCEYDTSLPDAPCIPKTGRVLSFKDWCDDGQGSGKGPMGKYDASYTTTCNYSYPTDDFVNFPTGFDNFTAPCVPFCGLEEQLYAACPYARWTLRRGTPGATVGSLQIRENDADATVITPGTAGTEPTLLAEGYAEYTFKRTGRISFGSPEFAMTLMADIANVDLTVSGNYYFSLTPECTLIDTNNAVGHVTGDGADQWNLPYIFLSNVAFPEADLYTLANAYGPVQPENTSLFNGQTYDHNSTNTSWAYYHEEVKWVYTHDVLDARAEAFEMVDAPDRWSMGINMIWVPKTTDDCTTCFGVGSECEYLAEQNGAKFDTIKACVDYITKNIISIIPPGFLENNTNLAELYLSNNHISSVPPDFLKSNTALTNLTLHDNRWDCTNCYVHDFGKSSIYESAIPSPTCYGTNILISDAGLYFNCTNSSTASSPQPVNTTVPVLTTPTPELSPTEISLIAVGGVVFSALAGFAIYKWGPICRGAMGYKYIF